MARRWRLVFISLFCGVTFLERDLPMLRCCAVLMCVASLACAQHRGGLGDRLHRSPRLASVLRAPTSYANGVNDYGQVTGYWGTLGSCYAYTYSGGTATQITTPYAVSLGEGVNDSGQVAGWDYPPFIRIRSIPAAGR